MTLVINTVDRHGLSNETHCKLLPKKTVLRSVLSVVQYYKMECFTYKSGRAMQVVQSSQPFSINQSENQDHKIHENFLLQNNPPCNQNQDKCFLFCISVEEPESPLQKTTLLRSQSMRFLWLANP